MSTSTPDKDRSNTSGDELQANEEGVGIGLDDEPNTFEPEEDPEAENQD